MCVRRKPKIGDTMFHVCEHLYYVPEHAAPLREYCICAATVVGFLKGGYTEVKLVGKNPEGFNTPYYYKMTEVGSKVFFDTLSLLPSTPKVKRHIMNSTGAGWEAVSAGHTKIY